MKLGCVSSEAVRTMAVLSLLLNEGLERRLDRCKPMLIEDRSISCCLPILVCKTDRVAM